MDPAPGSAPAAPHRFAAALALLVALAALLAATAPASGPGVQTPAARSAAAAAATPPARGPDRDGDLARDAARPGDGEPTACPAQARPRPAHLDERPSPPDPRTGSTDGASAGATACPCVRVPTRSSLPGSRPAQDSGRSPPTPPGI
ncbi:hypothetical protein OG753_38295 [Streptomyces sp. NBC_00029]|uniref:hypothetical protein n=1 Tax=Streptomyces sp. NBC_00029 TaxID=2903613 RepID=UPI0032453B99